MEIHFQIKDNWFAGQAMTPTVPRSVNLLVDPFEQHMDAPGYPLYAGKKLWTVMPAGYILKMHAETFKEFPPRQAPAQFNPDAMLAQVLQGDWRRFSGRLPV